MFFVPCLMRERSGWNIETLVCWDIALLARMMLRLEVRLAAAWERDEVRTGR